MSYRFDVNKPMQVGGQAVIEGVMMRVPGMIATAVRKANGEIAVKKESFRSLGERYRLLRVPVLRGAVGLIEMLAVGIRALNFSAEVAMAGMGVSGAGGGNGEAATSNKAKLALTVTVSLLVGIAIFFVTPLIGATLLFDVDQDPLLFNLLAGTIRITLLTLYLLSISRMRDIQRLFAYHGAEHKAVFAFESGGPLDVSTAARQSRFHPRCGTSFLLVVMFVAIILFGFLDALVLQVLGQIDIFIRMATHLPLIPLVGGVSYEFIRASAKRSNTLLGRLIVTPGLWLQRITTKEPDRPQLDVALAALRGALGEEVAASVHIVPQLIAAAGK